MLTVQGGKELGLVVMLLLLTWLLVEELVREVVVEEEVVEEVLIVMGQIEASRKDAATEETAAWWAVLPLKPLPPLVLKLSGEPGLHGYQQLRSQLG